MIDVAYFVLDKPYRLCIIILIETPYSMMLHRAMLNAHTISPTASSRPLFQNTTMNSPTLKAARFAIAAPETPVSSAAAEAARSPAPAFATTKTLDCFAVPHKKDYRSRTGLVHCVVRREVSQGRFGLASNRITFALQKRDGTEIVLLVATKKAAGNINYTISDLSSKQGKQLGDLSAGKSAKSLVYSLYQENEQVAAILYQVPSIINVVLDGRPRRAQIAISASQAHVQQKSGILEAKSKISIHKSRSLQGIDDHPFLHVFENKDPYSKGGGRWGLDFHGRGRLASSKNTQMENKEGVIVFQIAKWDKHAYSVDFRAPFNMFQAFGFALAQIVL
jgi:hypothetical protein